MNCENVLAESWVTFPETYNTEYGPIIISKYQIPAPLIKATKCIPEMHNSSGTENHNRNRGSIYPLSSNERKQPIRETTGFQNWKSQTK